MLLHEILELHESRQPGSPALVCDGRTLSFADLSTRVRRVSSAIAQLTEPGERVAFVGTNCAAWVECYYGVPRAGRILVFLNHRHAVPELLRTMRRSGASLVIGPAESVGPLREQGRGASPPFRVVDLEQYDELVAGSQEAPAPGALDPDSTAWIIYTSGTTGSPKGVMVTHASLTAAVEVTAACRPVAPDEVYLFAFPLCHIAGYNLINHHLHGRPVVLLAGFQPADFAEAARLHGATTTSLAATMLSDLLDHLEEEELELPTLRTIAYGAAPMPAALLRRADSLLKVGFAQGYGMTELSGNAVFLGPSEHRRGLDSDPGLLKAAGRPGPGVSLQVAGEDDRPVPPGELGEILLRGPQVTPGYWEDPESSRSALRGGWLHTGDMGILDDGGWLYVVDRKKDVIVTGGENVSTREVEDVLHGHPGVQDVAVVGVPDRRWGENVCAVVVPQPGWRLQAADLAQAVAAELAGYKKPRHVVMVEALPRNSSGKMVKGEVRRWLLENPRLLGRRL